MNARSFATITPMQDRFQENQAIDAGDIRITVEDEAELTQKELAQERKAALEAQQRLTWLKHAPSNWWAGFPCPCSPWATWPRLAEDPRLGRAPDNLVRRHQFQRPHQRRVIQVPHAVGRAGLHQLRRARGLRQ